MATKPEGKVQKIGEILAINADDIETGDRLRPVDQAWAESLGKVMVAEGQRAPIEVCRLPGSSKYTLVSGGHRHAAATMFPQLSPLKAIVVDNNALDRKAAEISENLWRKGLEPLERATFIAELVTVQKLRLGIDPERDGRAASANARWQKQVKADAEDATATIAVAYGWAEDVGEKLHLSARTIRDDLMLVRRIPAGLVELLRKYDHPVLRSASQLKALAKLDDHKQREAVELLCWKGKSLSRPQPRNMAEALAALDRRPKKSAEDKRLSAFIGTFQRMSTAEKKGALEHLAALLPAGFRLVDGDASDRAETAMRTRMLDTIGALDTAFKVLGQLVDGEPTEDEHLQDACAEVQHALMGLNDLKKPEGTANGA